MDCNPNGWNSSDFYGRTTWRMLYGMDINSDKGLLLVADNFGYISMLDGRSNKRVGEPILIHRKGSKVVGLHCNSITRCSSKLWKRSFCSNLGYSSIGGQVISRQPCSWRSRQLSLLLATNWKQNSNNISG